MSHSVAASILSTVDGTKKLDGTTLEVVVGIVLGQEKARPFFIGEVPSNHPPESFWNDTFLELPIFQPPEIDPEGNNGIPHLNLDKILNDLIGDLL